MVGTPSALEHSELMPQRKDLQVQGGAWRTRATIEVATAMRTALMVGTPPTGSEPLNGSAGDRQAIPQPGRGIPRLGTGLDKPL